MDWPQIFGRLASALFPQRCLFCDEVVAYEDFWCAKCGKAENPPCTKLGRVECELPHSFTAALAAIEYSGEVRRLIWRLKDNADKRILQFFSGEMHAIMAEYWQDIRFDLIVPVPSTASKLKARGFNQAGLLADCLSRHAAIPVRHDMLIRHESTQVQHNLTAAQRLINAAESYDTGNPEGASGKTALLVDDVFTTGSTAIACSDKLLAAGADHVYVITASRVHRRQQS